MFKLTSNLFVLACIVMVVIALIVTISPHDTNNYMAAARDKHRLLYSVKSPRIILVGGSNLAFSVDSEKIEKRFGFPVVNMGLHFGTGLRFMLDEVEPSLRNGDIVVIFPEYEHFTGSSHGNYGSPEYLGAVIKFCPECISGFRLDAPRQMLNAAIGVLQLAEGDILRSLLPIKRYFTHSPPEEDAVYSRKGFNQQGDMVAHLNQTTKLELSGGIPRVKEVTFPNPTVDLLNSFYRSANTANVQVFFIFPAIPLEDNYEAQRKEFIAFNDLLRANLKIPILGTPQDFFYPKDFFYDTVYHMNRVGRDARTDHIIDMLGPALQK